jgi:thioesterase domain-containing protein/acyl carrier protein
MAADLSTAGVAPDKLMPDDGLEQLDLLLATAGQTQAIVAPLADFVAEFPASAVPPLLCGLVDLDGAGLGSANSAELKATLLAQPSVAAREAHVRAVLAVRVKQLLGLAAEAVIEPADPLSQLGLDSLMIMELRNVVRAELGVALSPESLVTGPTLQNLAALIVSELGLSSGTAVASHSITLELTPRSANGHVTPIFCVQGAGRGDAMYSELAKSLGTEQPFYEMRCTVPADGTDVDVIELATSLLAEVAKVQPTGDVVLAGWSFGGLVAFEMARQLRADAASSMKLARLVLIDLVEPGMALPTYAAESAAVGAIVRSTELLAGAQLPAEVVDAGTAQMASLALADKVKFAVGLLKDHGVLLPNGPHAALATPDGVEELTATAKSFAQSIGGLLAYAPSGAPSVLESLRSWSNDGLPVLAFRPTAEKFRLEGMTEFDWGTSGVEVVELPGDHWELLKPPCVQALANRMSC